MGSPSSRPGPAEPGEAPPHPGPQQPQPGAGLPPSYPPTGYPPAGYYQPGTYWPPPPIQKPTGWFIVTWLFVWPLAIYSLVSAWQNIDPAYYHGDLAGAQFQCRRVRKFGIISLCVGIALIIVWISLPVILVATLGHECRQNPNGC